MPETSHARTDVVLGIVGIGALAVRGSLVAVLEAELHSMNLSLVERPPTEALSAWAASVTRSERAILAVLLDGRSERAWRLVVIDTARGRAIARVLPGGIEQDAASVEAVASIVISAASALREGLEVASSPVEAVVDSSPRATPPPRTEPAVNVPQGAWNAPAQARSFLRGAVAASVASFSPDAATTEGVGVALGASIGARIEVRVFGALFWPVLIQSPLGNFRVNRAVLGATSGPVFTAGDFAFTPEVGLLAERVHRFETAPEPGLFATEAHPLYRFGGVVALRLRHTLIRPLSVELVTGGAYFGRGVRFSATGAENARLAEAWPAVAFGQLGLDITTE